MNSLSKILFGIVLLYLFAYSAFRTSQAQVWEADGNTYVIFPQDPILIYYAFRPISYLDGKLTGMRFHIGPHQ